MGKAEKIAHQAEQLRIGGYWEEAATLESLAKNLNLRAEHKYLMCFVSDNSFYDQHLKNQLRALWTAFCFHAKWEADTQPYDNTLLELWEILANRGAADWKDFNDFDNFMCEFLA